MNPTKVGRALRREGQAMGKTEVDKTDNDVGSKVVTPSVTTTWHGTQVAKLDQQEFPLMGGKWAGKGAIQKAVEI